MQIIKNIFIFIFMTATGLAAAVPPMDAATPPTPSQTPGDCKDPISCFNQCRDAGHFGGVCIGGTQGKCLCEA